MSLRGNKEYSIVPFVDNFPKNTKLYQLMSTKPGEIQEMIV